MVVPIPRPWPPQASNEVNKMRPLPPSRAPGVHVHSVVRRLPASQHICRPHPSVNLGTAQSAGLKKAP